MFSGLLFNRVIINLVTVSWRWRAASVASLPLVARPGARHASIRSPTPAHVAHTYERRASRREDQDNDILISEKIEHTD